MKRFHKDQLSAIIKLWYLEASNDLSQDHYHSHVHRVSSRQLSVLETNLPPRSCCQSLKLPNTSGISTKKSCISPPGRPPKLTLSNIRTPQLVIHRLYNHQRPQTINCHEKKGEGENRMAGWENNRRNLRFEAF